MSAVAVGGLLVAGVAGAAVADEQFGADDVEVSVEVVELSEPGVLALSVASGSTSLSEEGSSELVRQFTGSLPTVTVTDTRDPSEVPEGAGWYVLGTASDFVGDGSQPTIGAEHLGWAPQILDGGESGLVAEGDQVDTVLDGGPNGVGLVDVELLALALDSSEVLSEGQWTATADLFLRTPASVEPGTYSSTLTLSLFE